MNTTKRIISLLMCMLMVLSIVPMMPGAVQKVEAAETETINITGLDLNPVVGQVPDTTAECDKEYVTMVIVEWYDFKDATDNSNAVKITGNIEVGMDVKCKVTVFSATGAIPENAKATIDGGAYGFERENGNIMSCYIPFGVMTPQVPDTVNITGLDLDLSVGETLDTSVTADTDKVICTVGWTDYNNDITLTKAEYYTRPQMRLEIKAVEGYRFTNEPVIKVNGIEIAATPIYVDGKDAYVYIKVYDKLEPPADKVISEVGFTGECWRRQNIVIGKAPMIDLVCLDERVNFSCWFKDDITGNKITKFEAGQEPRLMLEITPKSGYLLSPYEGSVMIYFDGNLGYTYDNSMSKATCSIPYGVLKYSDIKSLNITDYAKPSPNHAPDTVFRVSDDNVASASIVWTDSNGNPVTKFEAGKTYTCEVNLVGKEGHGFDNKLMLGITNDKGIPWLRQFSQYYFILTDYNNKLVATATYTIPADAAEEHTWDAATCTTPKTCKECGTTEGSKLGHSYTNACDTTCNRSGCGATRSITHDYAAATCTVAKKCKVCGTTSGSKLGHSYTNACDTTCNRCSAKRTITHSYKNVTTKATLTKNGKVENKCSVCGNVKSTTTVYYPKTIKLSKTAYTYNGKVQTPSVTVKDSKGNTLKKDTDYTVKYESGRKNPGTYTVTITFKGKYTGTKKLTYTIAPKATTKVTASQTTTTITLKWNKVTGADGYRVYKYNTKTKKYEKLKDVTGTSLKISKLTAGTKYKYKVRAYTKDDGTIWGAYSAVFETATKAKTPTLKVSSSKKGVAALSWSNVSGESGYQVYYSTKKDSGFKKLASYKTNVVKGSKSKLTSGKTYYFKVRAYTKTDSGTVYSAWSAVKSAKIK